MEIEKKPNQTKTITKDDIANQLCKLIKEKKLSNPDVIKLLDISEVDFALILNGKVDKFAIHKLVSFIFKIVERDKK